jgi:hypothetical protein
MVHTRIATVDAVLNEHSATIGRDLVGYRNHVYRVANICLSLTTDAGDVIERVGIAAVFHDLGIWTHHTFDYIEPSVELARAHLGRTGREPWTDEVTAMIREHHKISRDAGHMGPLVEAFRRADWADVSRGILARGIPRGLIGGLFAEWPSAGFHARLVQLSWARLKSHPLSPLPMLRL